MSHTHGQATTHGAHGDRDTTSPGQCRQATQILIFDTNGHLGIQSPYPLEKGGCDLRPDTPVVTTHDYQVVG